MEKALYLNDSYLKEFEAIVTSVKEGKFIVLDKTVFYPNSGGQPHDTGTMINDAGESYEVVFAGKFSGVVSHEVDKEGLKKGDSVKCSINWNRRHRFMRSHTASHILSGIIHKKTGAKITGNQIKEDKIRIDFSLENFDREEIKHYEAEANEIIKKNL